MGKVEGESKGSKGSDDDVKMNRDIGDEFRRRRPVSTEGREGCPAMEACEKGERGENGGFPHSDRSPTRTHLHKTGTYLQRVFRNTNERGKEDNRGSCVRYMSTECAGTSIVMS